MQKRAKDKRTFVEACLNVGDHFLLNSLRFPRVLRMGEVSRVNTSDGLTHPRSAQFDPKDLLHLPQDLLIEHRVPFLICSIQVKFRKVFFPAQRRTKNELTAPNETDGLVDLERKLLLRQGAGNLPLRASDEDLGAVFADQLRYGSIHLGGRVNFILGEEIAEDGISFFVWGKK